MTETKTTKDRGIAIILALFLGGFGAHRFYLGQVGWGLVFLLFFWTFIPTIFALIDVVRYASLDNETFRDRYSY